MRDRLDNMGPINPMAMEAYTEIKQRNDFIIAQKEDLLKAKESLFNTITEIEAVASTTFMEAFNKIKEHFIRVFRSLFTEGDECDLRLVDPNNPLESEIDIIAKPKGKETTYHQPAFRWRKDAYSNCAAVFDVPVEACTVLYLR